MKTISQLASEIRGDKYKEKDDCGFKRLTDTLNKFNEDFKCVIPELIACNVKYEACFLHKKKDGNYYFFPQDTLFGNSVCTCNSILFTFEHNGKERKKRLFYNQNYGNNDKGWYYIARNGNLMNDNLYLKNYRDDLILYLDGTFEGEYK